MTWPRKHPTHGTIEIVGNPTIVFCTICTHGREQWLANHEVHETLRDVWQRADHWLVGRYVVMPDHVHFFAGFTGAETPLENWVQYVKSQFTKRYRRADCRWQTDHWDRRIRSFNDYEPLWQYVLENPVRKELVRDSNDWPFQGQIYFLPWD